MKLLITGARGFLGRALVAAAVEAGHDVVALVRSSRSGSTDSFPPHIEVLEADLRHVATAPHVDVVVHAAAAAGGDRAQQLSNTVVATEKLLDALMANPPARFVHVSSLSVLDYHSPAVGATLDEASPLEEHPARRDAYTEAKLLQERLVRRWCAAMKVHCVVTRPGAIVGPGRTWDHGAALSMGPVALVVAPRAQFRLISLANCAEAIIRAAEVDGADGQTINLVDDDLPTNAEYFRRCRRRADASRVLVPVPWRFLDVAGRLVHLANVALLGGRLRTPEILDHYRQEARWKPLHYSNERAHRVLGWSSRQPLDEAIRVSTATELGSM